MMRAAVLTLTVLLLAWLLLAAALYQAYPFESRLKMPRLPVSPSAGPR